MTPNPITDTNATGTEISMLRFMAAAGRPLKHDAKLTAMGAFDTLQKIHKKYKDNWLSIWIVCMDGEDFIVPQTPVSEALRRIEDHGGAAGIVGVTIIARMFTFLKKPLKIGKSLKQGMTVTQLLDWSGNGAADRLLKLLDPIVLEKKLLRDQLKDSK